MSELMRGLNSIAHRHEVAQLVRDRGIQFVGLLETRVRRSNVQAVRAGLLPNWAWFDDYAGPGGRIWLAWDELEVSVEVLMVGEQFIHCRLGNKRTSANCLISVVYGECDPIRRRLLWVDLLTASATIGDSPWCALGDFNIVIDESESLWGSAEVSHAMAEFREFIMDAGLIHLPFTGCPFTWHNCSSGRRSLWRRLDRALVNDIWLNRWPHSTYLSALPMTSDHSPLILLGAERRPLGVFSGLTIFWLINRGFSFQLGKCGGIASLGLQCMGSLALMEKAQALFDEFKDDILLQLVQCRTVYCKAVLMEDTMLRQRAKLRWLKDGDRCSKAFFRKINATRAKLRVFQITNSAGDVLTMADQVVSEFLSYYETLLGGERQNRSLNLDFLKPYLKHTLSSEEIGKG
ncbi:UNVERIFIED_CONTAM: hypothetical protein Sradi_6917200 [Sesamum radiatum]|uniref:Endonuclease/exonuclease/phosphatase domain-containing protein n=1 Tax=Sesamum radiatum TaxID=300843 RepID=A0AAW2JHU4_SESRA